jgi:uroporphyrinogen decarboxylase
MMQRLKNDRLLRALRREPVDCTPVWLMRQAGRYLPEYRKLRAKAGDFMTLCKTPALACEVTLQPLRRFALDAAILFSDILTIPDAMGLGLQFVEGEGPQFAQVVDTQAAVDKLPIPRPEIELAYVLEAIQRVQQALDGEAPLIGFAGSPWTLATYMVEGKSSRRFARIKTLLYQAPQVLHALLEKLAAAVILYLNAQIKAGIDVVMLFDTWGGILTTPQYVAFSLYYMQKIIAGLTAAKTNRKIPIIVFTKGGGAWLENIADIGCDAIGLDWTVDIATAKARVGHRAALQGNLDPAALYASPEKLCEEIRRIIDGYGQERNRARCRP